jgi:hypothetical protein
MASITQRRTKSGQLRYFVAVRIKGQPAVRETFHGKAAAKEWARNVEDGLRSGRLAPRPEAEKHPLADVIDRYLEDHLVDLGMAADEHEVVAGLEDHLRAWVGVGLFVAHHGQNGGAGSPTKVEVS